MKRHGIPCDSGCPETQLCRPGWLQTRFFFLKHNRDLLRKNEKELPRVRGQGAKREDYLALLSLSA